MSAPEKSPPLPQRDVIRHLLDVLSSRVQSTEGRVTYKQTAKGEWVCDELTVYPRDGETIEDANDRCELLRTRIDRTLKGEFAVETKEDFGEVPF